MLGLGVMLIGGDRIENRDHSQVIYGCQVIMNIIMMPHLHRLLYSLTPHMEDNPQQVLSETRIFIYSCLFIYSRIIHEVM